MAFQGGRWSCVSVFEVCRIERTAERGVQPGRCKLTESLLVKQTHTGRNHADQWRLGGSFHVFKVRPRGEIWLGRPVTNDDTGEFATVFVPVGAPGGDDR